MSNLTEQEGLRKLLSVEQFNRQTHIEHEPGVVGRLIKWLFGGPKVPADGKVTRKLSESDVQVLRELEVGTEVSLRREEWDDYRVMIVDQRLRVHPISGINALTQEMEQITLDINIAYKVFDVNFVAFGSDDPLAFLQNRVIETALGFLGNLPLREVGRSGKDIAWEIKQLGRIVECGLEVIDARVSVILPHELIDKMTRTNRILQDAEAMILEKETNARVQERVSKIDFDAELRTIQNQQSIEKIKDLYSWEKDRNVVDHETDIERRRNEARRRNEYDNERHKISIFQMKFNAFKEMLSSVGIHPRMAIMMMEGDNWQRFFERFQKLVNSGEDNRNTELKAIHGHINNLITSKRLTEDNIQKLLGYFEDETKYLGGNPSIMKQFESFLSVPDNTSSPNRQIADAGPENNTRKFIDINDEVDHSANRDLDETIADDNQTRKYPARGDLNNSSESAE